MNNKTIFILAVAFALAGGLTFASMAPFLMVYANHDGEPHRKPIVNACGPNNDKDEPPCGGPKKMR